MTFRVLCFALDVLMSETQGAGEYLHVWRKGGRWILMGKGYGSGKMTHLPPKSALPVTRVLLGSGCLFRTGMMTGSCHELCLKCHLHSKEVKCGCAFRPIHWLDWGDSKAGKDGQPQIEKGWIPESPCGRLLTSQEHLHWAVAWIRNAFLLC